MSPCLAADAAPAVVHDDFILAGRFVVEPSQELLASPFLGIRHVPIAVGEDEGRAVLGYDVLDLRQEMLVDIARAIRLPERVIPFVERIVDSHFDPAFAHGGGHFSQHVAFRAGVLGVPARTVRAGPEAEAIVVVGRHHDVFRSRFGKQVGPIVGIEKFTAHHRPESMVIEIGAVVLYVEVVERSFSAPHVVPIPFGILALGRVGRHAVRSPANHHAEAGRIEPFGDWPLIERFPIRLILLAQGRRGGEKQSQYQCHKVIRESHEAFLCSG